MDDDNGGAYDTQEASHLSVEIESFLEQLGGENSTGRRKGRKGRKGGREGERERGEEGKREGEREGEGGRERRGEGGKEGGEEGREGGREKGKKKTERGDGGRLARSLPNGIVVHPPMYLLENVEHCGGKPEQAGYCGYMHMNRLSFTLK